MKQLLCATMFSRRPTVSSGRFSGLAVHSRLMGLLPRIDTAPSRGGGKNRGGLNPSASAPELGTHVRSITPKNPNARHRFFADKPAAIRSSAELWGVDAKRAALKANSIKGFSGNREFSTAERRKAAMPRLPGLQLSLQQYEPPVVKRLLRSHWVAHDRWSPLDESSSQPPPPGASASGYAPLKRLCAAQKKEPLRAAGANALGGDDAGSGSAPGDDEEPGGDEEAGDSGEAGEASEAALRAYEVAQMERVHWIVERSAAQGKTVYEDREEFMKKQGEAQDSMWGIQFDALEFDA